MNEHTTVSAKQLCTLVFLSLAVDMAVRPFTSGGSAGAQIAILAAVLNTAVVSILLLPVLGLLRREAFTTLKGGVTFGSKALLTLSAVLFAAGGAAAMVRSEAFFRYVSDEPMPQLLVYGLFLLVVFYALRCGLEDRTCARSGRRPLFTLYGTDAGLQPGRHASVEPYLSAI